MLANLIPVKTNPFMNLCEKRLLSWPQKIWKLVTFDIFKIFWLSKSLRFAWENLQILWLKTTIEVLRCSFQKLKSSAQTISNHRREMSLVFPHGNISHVYKPYSSKNESSLSWTCAKKACFHDLKIWKLVTFGIFKFCWLSNYCVLREKISRFFESKLQLKFWDACFKTSRVMLTTFQITDV